jgi:hypothetical protein
VERRGEAWERRRHERRRPTNLKPPGRDKIELGLRACHLFGMFRNRNKMADERGEGSGETRRTGKVEGREFGAMSNTGAARWSQAPSERSKSWSEGSITCLNSEMSSNWKSSALCSAASACSIELEADDANLLWKDVGVLRHIQKQSGACLSFDTSGSAKNDDFQVLKNGKVNWTAPPLNHATSSSPLFSMCVEVDAAP